MNKASPKIRLNLLVFLAKNETFIFQKSIGEAISEKDLLDSEKYPWLEGHPLAFILVASYDHHQEHLEKWTAWLQFNGK